jgi:hypothetical protein
MLESHAARLVTPAKGDDSVPDITVFHLYRYMLVIVVSCYVTVRLVTFIWRWQLNVQSAERPEALVRRYAVTLFLRVRLRRFWFDFLQIGTMLAALIYIVMLHRNGPMQ